MSTPHRIGVFGGSFNPPHLAHLIIAETVREQAELDEICWMPSAHPPHKFHDLAPAPDRLAMTRLAIADHPHFTVSDLELQRSGPSYTVETLRLLREEEPEHQFFLILGGDSLQQFHTWRQPMKILEMVNLLVYARPGADTSAVAPEILAQTHLVTAPLLEISGTAIRARHRAGQSLRYMVPDAVRAFIEAEGLYAP